MSQIITVLFPTGQERTFCDLEDFKFIAEVVDGHLKVDRVDRLIPGGKDNWKTRKLVNAYAPGVWSEVEIDYI